MATLTIGLAGRYWQSAYTFSKKMDHEWIQEFVQAKSGADVSVVMFGTSRLRHALNFDYHPSVLVPLSDGRKMTVLRVGINAGSFNGFEHLAEDVLQAQPDFLFIEEHLLSNDSRGSGDKENSMFWILRSIDNYFNRIFVDRSSLKEGWWVARSQVFSVCFKEFTQKLLTDTIQERHERDHYNLEGEEPKAMRAYIEKALESDIKVVIFKFPAYRKKIAEYGYPPYMLDVGENMDQVPPAKAYMPENYDKVTWLTYKTPDVPEELYCDYSHYNERGRDLASKWFVSQIVALSKK